MSAWLDGASMPLCCVAICKRPRGRYNFQITVCNYGFGLIRAGVLLAHNILTI